MKIDSDFPGGNIVVDQIASDTIDVHQDLRDTSEWWFWWALRVTGGAGRTVTFRFTNGDVFTTGGPCASWNGVDWHWLGRTEAKQTSFTLTIPADVDEAYFALAPLYTQRHLELFLDSLSSCALERRTLCISEQGRSVELLYAPATVQTEARTVAIIARTHACEVSASFVVEGVLRHWLTSQDSDGSWLRQHYNLLVVPFMDKDGVENGDQGKARRPHDHNRDFCDSALYASVRALQHLLLRHAGSLDLFLDVHSPWIRGGLNDTIFFIGLPEPWQTELNRLTAFMEQLHAGPLPYRATDTIGHGVDWNKGEASTSVGWVREAINPSFAGLVEVGYSVANGVAITPRGLRDFGTSLARAIALYLQAA